MPIVWRLCILKGVYPREPKRKLAGQKTYYHAKDINYLLHEPLLAKGRDLKAYDKKIKKAKAKRQQELLERLQKRRPEHTLDHLVKERYPSFLDAVRELDDPLTLTSLFAVLPADKSHKIPVERVLAARRLMLEFQAYVTKVNALRKVFVSVKGWYFQAEVFGQTVTWLTPHPLSQALTHDVDYRVMLTFLEFYEAMLEFVNFKLYHSLGLSYPPVMDTKLTEAAADLEAIMRRLADTSNSKDRSAMDASDRSSKQGAAVQADPAAIAKVQQKLLAAVPRASEGEDGDAAGSGAAEEIEGSDDGKDEDAGGAALLFSGKVFFLARETPREQLMFVIRSFGGQVAWEGEGSPLEEGDDSINYQVVDRPKQGHVFLSRDYVQPQWVLDSANNGFLLPVDKYVPGIPPPPHLSPFVDATGADYVPEYAETVLKLKESALASGAVLPFPGAEAELQQAVSRAHRSEEAVEAAQDAELAKQEAQYQAELAKELSGVPYSESLAQASAKKGGADKKRKSRGGKEASSDEEEGEGEGEDSEDDEEDEEGSEEEVEEEEEGKRVPLPSDVKADEGDEAHALARMMMPRKHQKLYAAMQHGKQAKQEVVDRLKQRREQLKAAQKDQKKPQTPQPKKKKSA
eukprot:jgi/Mesvir1/20436/Mv12333-RA.1